MARPTPGAPRWLTSTAKTIRNSSRLTSATDRVFGAIQGNRTAVDVATRVFAFDAAVPVVFLRSGKPLEGVAEVERLPVLVIDAVGVSPETLVDLAADVVALQERTQGFRPLFVVSTPAFRLFRELDYPVELVLPRESWSFAGTWEAYVARRLAMILARYRAWTIVSARSGALVGRDRELIEALEGYRPWEARKI